MSRDLLPSLLHILAFDLPEVPRPLLPLPLPLLPQLLLPAVRTFLAAPRRFLVGSLGAPGRTTLEPPRARPPAVPSAVAPLAVPLRVAPPTWALRAPWAVLAALLAAVLWTVVVAPPVIKGRAAPKVRKEGVPNRVRVPGALRRLPSLPCRTRSND